MALIKIENIHLTEDEQTAIRAIAEKWNQQYSMVDWREPTVEITDLLYVKLEALGTGSIQQHHGRILTFNSRLKILVDNIDHAVEAELNRDRWEVASKWFRSKPWSLPLMVVLVGLPTIVQYVEMISYVLKYCGLVQK